ncbi:DUF3618 domain-containing protein [Lysobacter korlensis]|uniref:DUF3618 domain-containing protein n=1 Tax=Lysobacter korlensis TaxID=553636 RepID=A0ABV6RWT6_9GAMM
MPSTESERLRPGAGQNEIELFVTKTRDELDSTMDELRERFDVKTRSKRAVESFRRDYDKNPTLWQSTGVGIVAVGAIMVVIALVKRGQNG